MRGESKYFNDVHAFDLQEMVWKKLEISGVKPPSPRSGCNLFVTLDGRIVLYGGYCKEKVKTKVTTGKKGGDSAKEVGKTLDDMFLLVPDKHDETLTKWRWHNVKQTGNKPNPRSGISSVAVPNSNKALFFGGVNDEENGNHISDDEEDDEMRQGNFYSDLYSCLIENEKATWQKIEMCGTKTDPSEKKRRRGAAKEKDSGTTEKHDDDGELSEETDEDSENEEAAARIERLAINSNGDSKEDNHSTGQDCTSVRVVEDGAFTISSTIVHTTSEQSKPKQVANENENSSRGIKINANLV